MSHVKIPPELYPYLEEVGQSKRYAPGETIYLQGDRADRLYLIRSGRVRAYWVSTDGRELTFEIIERWRIFGESSFLSSGGCPVSVEAVTEVELLACRIQRLAPRLGESPALTLLLLRMLSNTCNHLTLQLRRATLYDRYQKIASLLLEETAHPDRDRGVTSSSIPYTQDDLAMILGLNRVTVNRVLQEWKKKGAVQVSYGNIHITDRDYLASLLPHF